MEGRKVMSLLSPFEELAAGTSSRSPVPASKEEAALFGTRFTNHPFATFDSTETARMKYWKEMKILRFVRKVMNVWHGKRQCVPVTVALPSKSNGGQAQNGNIKGTLQTD
ncbi:hypothetical protein Tco_0536138 [Tanacetum coccineum]